MLQEIHIENYKSIQKLKLGLGRVTVLIGENGSGKSNILEAIALASAAANDKLDNEFLFSRGIRVTEPEYMRSAFDKEQITQGIKINFYGKHSDFKFGYVLQNNNKPYSSWLIEENKIDKRKEQEIDNDIREKYNPIIPVNVRNLKIEFDNNDNDFILETIERKKKQFIKKEFHQNCLDNFLIYSPEIFALRQFEKEGQIQPLGINGEGLFKLLKVLSLDPSKITELKEKLKLLFWFEDFTIQADFLDSEKSLKTKDRYLAPDLSAFDQKSANEGFLFLLFYFALFISDDTPRFFAIDNIDASLNPKLCSQLMRELIQLAKKYDKQVIVTTHNPAILDGLDLDDPEQQLWVIYRNKFGHTKARPVEKPAPLEGQDPVKLSEAFMRGYIGGLPKNF
ncbi:MAG: AAA family ATPase [Coleofasciculus sp. C1-SOL-03]|jgi:predicted ATPase|uniref:AAA family ATPase n=1 Tax=Coleofasciculus sp. C1-SOL-03 TaxID=3069522 RepID=UPI0032F3B2F5